MKINDLNRIALGISAAEGISLISLGFRLIKKPDKTPEEAAAAKAFIKIYRYLFIILAVVCIAIFVATGFMMSDTGTEYDGEYAERRTGRIVDGQIRYVKNELYYIDPQDYGLPADIPDGTSISVYFDEYDNVVACTNMDEFTAIRMQRVIIAMIVYVCCIIGLVAYAMIARFTFGKPWYRWIASVRA